MIKLETIKRIADDILSDVEWVNDSHSEAEYEGIKGGLNRLIRHIEETHEDNQIIDNGLIAEFMGMKEHKGSHYSIIKGEWIPNVELEYHESWDWLMPVVEKIESLGYKFEKNLQRIDRDWQCLIIKGNDILYQEFNTDSRIACHYVVVEFIKTYNRTKL